jgi:SEC-C motif-containing protein
MSILLSEASETETCLCGSELSYAACCGGYHSGESAPPTAEALMRSRFTAYARRNVEYLMASWDPAKRPAVIDFSKETALWQKLLIVNIKKGNQQDSKGIVEFKAFYSQDGCDYYLHEISRFIKAGQGWLYLDGIIKAAGKVTPEATGGKNAPCACGSGKKFKRCCGASQ